MGERTWVMAMFVVVAGVFILSVGYMNFEMGMTGMAVFSDLGEGEFDLGSYDNVEWNGSVVVLSGDNLSGAYTSQVFDAGAAATWNSLDIVENSVAESEVYLSSAEYLGANFSEIFDLDGSYYLADMKDSSKRVYLNFSENLVDNMFLNIYARKEKGVGVGIYAWDDLDGSSPLGTFVVDSVVGDWYNVSLNIGSPIDAIWFGEGTGSGVDPKDEFDYVYARMPSTSVSFEVMNCSLSDCSDGVWQSVNFESVGLEGRYFKYKADFSSSIVGMSSGLESVSIDYDLMNSVPVISLESPTNRLYTSDTGLVLNYSVVDDNVDSCWYEIDSLGVVSLPGCLNSTFDVGSGNHVLVVYVNDTFGEVSNDSVAFDVDVNGVFVSVVEPVGEKSSRTGIVLNYSVSGAEACWYNVETSIGGEVIGNTSLEDCNSSSFDVASDGDYVLNLFGNNSLGSFGMDSSGFSVDTSEDIPVPVVVIDGGGSSGGGGGGFSGGVVFAVAELEVDEISAIVSIGEEKSLVVSVKNIGKVSANKCSLVGDVDYVDASDILNIGVGEIVEFGFVLSVIDGVEDLDLSVDCMDNVSGVVVLDVTVLRPELDVSIEEISFDEDGKLFVGYSIDAIDSRTEVLYFRVVGSSEDVVEVSEEVALVFGEVYKGDVSIDVSSIDEGMLRVSIGDDEEVNFVEEDFIYEGAPVTGFVGLKVDGATISIGVIVFLFLIAAGFVVRRIWKLRKGISA